MRLRASLTCKELLAYRIGRILDTNAKPDTTKWLTLMVASYTAVTCIWLLLHARFSSKKKNQKNLFRIARDKFLMSATYGEDLDQALQECELNIP